jgi:hypothetical protein
MNDLMALMNGEKKTPKKPKLSDVFVMDKKISVVNNKKKKTKTNGKDITGNKKKKPKA